MEYRGWAFGHQSLYIKLLKWMNGWLLILISWKWKLLQYIKGTLTVQKSALGCIASPDLSDPPWNTSVQKSKIQNSYIYIFSSWSGKKLMLPWNWYIGKLHLKLNHFQWWYTLFKGQNCEVLLLAFAEIEQSSNNLLSLALNIQLIKRKQSKSKRSTIRN